MSVFQEILAQLVSNGGLGTAAKESNVNAL